MILDELMVERDIADEAQAGCLSHGLTLDWDHARDFEMFAAVTISAVSSFVSHRNWDYPAMDYHLFGPLSRTTGRLEVWFTDSHSPAFVIDMTP